VATLDKHHLIVISISDNTRNDRWSRPMIEMLFEFGVRPFTLIPYVTDGLSYEVAVVLRLYCCGPSDDTWAALVREIECLRGEPLRNHAGECNGLYERTGYLRNMDFDDVVELLAGAPA
jgi:hypothetical protein